MKSALPGRPTPLGATYDGGGTNFAVHSDVATSVEVCLFDAAGAETRYELLARNGSIHHGYLRDVAPGTPYGLRIHGPWAPWDGVWCNPAKLLIDPYAAAIDGDVEWDRAVYGFSVTDPDLPEPHDSAPFMPRCLVVDQRFEWGDDKPPHTPWNETVIYETHVRNLTMRHPDVPEALRGTYLGVASEPILSHLRHLGVTAVELMPVQQFVHDHTLIRQGLRNSWGYQPIGFFAPHQGYAAGASQGAQVTEFKEMVKRLHAAGLEVILDVVFNHTGESHHLGPNLSFRGIDNAAYYRLSDEDPRHYLDFAGVGNTINMDHPAVIRMVADALRNWVTEYHVDGFRFDLAVTLARKGIEFDSLAPFLQLVGQDPVLNQVKMIAEPWDVGPGGYRLGAFPPGWSEWNDQYRDDLRDYWRGHPGKLDEFASRLAGSSDILGLSDRRRPTASINLITSHDGYTLRDLVSYERKHNQANGQDNQDGHGDNRSWNGGVEGATEDDAITALRDRRRRSLLATLLLSQGVPMVLGGDELGRTQRGNNNAYAQDNETSWYDWGGVDEPFLEFSRRVIAFRREHPVLRRTAWLRGAVREVGGLEDVGWYTPGGKEMTTADWLRDHARALTVYLNGRALVAPHPDGTARTDDCLLLMFNAWTEPLEFTIPPELHGPTWHLALDTAREHQPDHVIPRNNGDVVIVDPFALVVLVQDHAQP